MMTIIVRIKNYHESILSWRIGISMPPRKRNQRKHKVLEYVDIKDMRHQNIQEPEDMKRRNK